MIRTLFFYLLLLISSSLLAQSTQLVKGTLVDENQQPVESATVFFAHAKDSTLIDYARSNARGEFVFKIKFQ